MNVLDEMRNLIDDANSHDECQYHVYAQMMDLIDDAEVENGKLREFVIDLASHLKECERIHGEETAVPDVYRDRMRELGIEVDDRAVCEKGGSTHDRR